MRAFLLASLLVAASAAHAATVKDAVRSSLEAGLQVEAELAAETSAEAEAEMEVEAEVGGIENCSNKCQNLLNNQAFMQQAQAYTYEYVACLAGCQICQAILSSKDEESSCSVVCKNTDWTKMVDPQGNPVTVTKGVIEPDKACIFGCLINLCQEVCQGGTTDMNPTPTNQPAWWGYGGCSLKTGGVRPGGYYSQNSKYNYANSQTGTGGQDDCCANAFSLCNYNALVGTTATNQANVLSMAQSWCKSVPGLNAFSTKDQICSFFDKNCGSNIVG